MVADLLQFLAQLIISVESALGYAGVLLLMAIESACIPLPSEVIMPFAGYLVSTGQFSLWGISLAGALGCVAGSIPAYYLGAYGGRPLVEKYGRYVLLSHRDLAMADKAFNAYGEWIVLAARLLPVVRTFIAFPAGVSRMNMPKFIAYTFIGSLPWCYALGYAGKTLGDRWDSLKPYFHRFDAVIGVVLVVGATWWIWRHFRGAKAAPQVTPPQRKTEKGL